jgi:transcriptional regulator with XRE-family HTH domain
MSNNNHHLQQLETFIRLVREGDPVSLKELREQLGKTRKEIADKIGVSEHELKCWELGEQQPSSKHHSFWKIRLNDYVDERIAVLIRTKDTKLVTHFWEILSHLSD